MQYIMRMPNDSPVIWNCSGIGQHRSKDAPLSECSAHVGQAAALYMKPRILSAACAGVDAAQSTKFRTSRAIRA